MAATGAVNIRLGLIVSDLIAGARAGQAAIARMAGEINGNLAASYANADRQQRVYDRGLGRLGNNMQDFGRKASVVTGILAGVGAAAFGSFAEIDSLKRGLTAVTGSVGVANSEFVKLRKVAELPGLGLTEAVQGSVRLQAVGFSANLAREALLQFGNAVATTGGGKTQLDQVTFQLGQLAAKGKVLSQDLRPIIEAAPSIAPVLNRAFGSVDPEIISDKLAAAGKSSKDFVEILISELSKLPRVSGGPKIAMENLGDSIQLASASFGEAADKALNLTGKINSLGSFIGRAADEFATLGPGAQASILGIAGLAAAVGPLTLGIGAAISLIPTFKAGLGTLRTALASTQAAALGLVTTVGAIAVAVGAVVGATYFVGRALDQYDAKLETSADRSKIFADVNNQVSTSISGETTKLNALLAVARDETISKEARLKAVKDLNAISPQYLGNLRLETINTAEAAKAVSAYSNALVLKAKVQVLSQRAAEAQVKADEVAAKSAKEFVDRGNFSADVLAVNVKTTFQNPFNGDTERAQEALFVELGKKRKNAAAQLAQNEANVLARALERAYVDANKSGIKLDAPQVETPNFNLLGNESELKKAKDRLKKLKEEIFAGKKAGANTAGLEAEAKALNEQIKAAGASTRRLKAETDSVGGALTTNERLLNLYTKQLKEQGDSASEQLKDRVRILAEAVAQDKLLAQPKKIEYDVKAVTNTKSFADAFNSLYKANAPILPGLANFKASLDSVNFYQNQITILRDKIAQISLQGLQVPAIAITSLVDYAKQLQKVDDAQVITDVQVDNKLGDSFLKVDTFSKVIENLRSGKNAVNLAASEVKNSMTSNRIDLANATSGLLSGIGESIGKGENPLKTALKAVLDFIGGYAIKIGTAALISSTALLAAAPFLGGLTLPQGIGLKATGAGLIVAGGLVKGIAAQPFANGGIVYGPTLGLMGEYSGARNNPEVIAPLNKLKSILGSQGPQVMIPDIVLDGQMIRIVLMRANESYAQFS